MIRLFDIKNGVVIPTEHCYNIKVLKDIMDYYGHEDAYLKVYSYLFYMYCPDEDLNPFANMHDLEKQRTILQQVDAGFSVEDELISEAEGFVKKLFETPTSRAYEGIRSMLDRLGDYMRTTSITHGRDGNITAIVNAAAKFEQIRTSYKNAYKDLKEEQKSAVRGKEKLAYDQR
jgi:hypothetical protein